MKSYSYSKINMFMACPHKYKLRYLLGIVPVGGRNALDLGGCMAEGVSAFRKTGDHSLAMNAFIAEWELRGKTLELESEKDPLRSVERGLAVLENYMLSYPDDPNQMIHPEVKFDIEPDFDRFGFSQLKGIHFTGRIDCVMALEKGGIAIDEDKTSTWVLSDYFFDGHLHSYQCLWYMVVGKELGLFDLIKDESNIAKCLVTGIYVHPTKYDVQRRMAFAMKPKLDIAYRNLCEWIYHIETCNVYPSANYDICRMFGGCEYLPFRWSNDQSNRRVIAANFTRDKDEPLVFNETADWDTVACYLNSQNSGEKNESKMGRSV